MTARAKPPNEDCPSPRVKKSSCRISRFRAYAGARWLNGRGYDHRGHPFPPHARLSECESHCSAVWAGQTRCLVKTWTFDGTHSTHRQDSAFGNLSWVKAAPAIATAVAAGVRRAPGRKKQTHILLDHLVGARTWKAGTIRKCPASVTTAAPAEGGRLAELFADRMAVHFRNYFAWRAAWSRRRRWVCRG
jgi:hypothetical protein